MILFLRAPVHLHPVSGETLSDGRGEPLELRWALLWAHHVEFTAEGAKLKCHFSFQDSALFCFTQSVPGSLSETTANSLISRIRVIKVLRKFSR